METGGHPGSVRRSTTNRLKSIGWVPFREGNHICLHPLALEQQGGRQRLRSHHQQPQSRGGAAGGWRRQERGERRQHRAAQATAVATIDVQEATSPSVRLTVDSGSTARTFLVLNDAVAGVQASSDALIEITGFSGNLNALAIL